MFPRLTLRPSSGSLLYLICNKKLPYRNMLMQRKKHWKHTKLLHGLSFFICNSKIRLWPSILEKWSYDCDDWLNSFLYYSFINFGGYISNTSSFRSAPQPGLYGTNKSPLIISGFQVKISSFHGTSSGSISITRKLGTAAQK